MDWDHRPGTVKSFDIGSAVAKLGIGLARLLEEIAKCDLVCSNCHRIRTHLRREAKMSVVSFEEALEF